jgi:hypothetical protein
MSTVHFDTGTYGAKRQSFHDASPRGLLEKVVKKNPKADEESLEEAHWDLMVKQPNFLEFAKAIHAYWFAPNLRSLTRTTDQQRRAHREERQTEAAAASATAEEVFAQTKRLVLLDLIMPNGKPLRDQTSKDLIKGNGFTKKLADKLKPGQTVGQVFSEDQVRKMWGGP